MRYTLSVVSAVCLMALGQPSWSSSLDRDLIERARIAAMALPAIDRHSAKAWLNALPAPHKPSTTRRHLPLSAAMTAVQQLVHQYERQTLQAYVLPAPTVSRQWLRPVTVELQARPNLQLDAAKVRRWATSAAARYATHTSPEMA